MTNTHWTISVVIIAVVGLALWLKYWLTKPAALNTGARTGGNGGGNTSPAPAKKWKLLDRIIGSLGLKVTFEISSKAFSIVFTTVVSTIVVLAIPFIISAVGGPDFKLTKFQVFALEFSVPILIIIGYFEFWRKKPKNKAENINDGYEIPNGHLGILEFLGEPIKLVVLSEGRLWLPWGFSVSMIDVREKNLRIPETPEKPGFKVTSKDNIGLLVAISCSGKVDCHQLYKALFEIREGSAEESARQSLISEMRIQCSNERSEDLVNASSSERKRVISQVVAGAKKICKDEHAYALNEKTFLILSFVYEDPETQAALEERTRIEKKEEALRFQEQKYTEQIVRLMDSENGPGLSREEATKQARLDRGQQDLSEVILSGDMAKKATPMVPIPTKNKKP